MKRHLLTPRPDLADISAEYGFDFYIIDGETYWDESKAYSFTLEQIENDIEDPTNEINDMLMAAVGRVIGNEQLLKQFDIPEVVWGALEQSWKRRDPSVYGRIDLCYNGTGPAKLYEANYDTPTSLFEAAVFQWDWMKARGFPDQYNSIHESLIKAWESVKRTHQVESCHFAGVLESVEDKYTIQYMMDTAFQAGLAVKLIDMQDIGLGQRLIDNASVYTDMEDCAMEALFKLYPYEHMFREQFASSIATTNTKLIEPVWKAVISNKAILALLWEMFPGHPNLIETYYGERKGFVRKAYFSREGSNISLPSGESTDAGEYSGGWISQVYTPLPKFGSDYPVIGSWVVGGKACGIGIREDNSLITKNTSRFVPHYIEE